MLELHADRPHVVPPQVFMPWKENWCFAGVDTTRSTAMVWHISLRPVDGEGVFTCKLDGPDVRVRHVERHPIGRGVEIGDVVASERMRLEVVEAHHRFLLAHRGDDVDVECSFDARFAPFDFGDGTLAPGESRIGELGRHVFPFHHYEQALTFDAVVRRAGHPDLELHGRGHRDHSWGWRDDFGFRSHHWICASFDAEYVQGSTMIDTTYPDRKHGGFVSGATGNDPIKHVDVSDTYWEEPAGQPLPELNRDVTYVLSTVSGRRIEIVAHLAERFRILYLNARHPGRSQAYQDAQVFCPFTLVATGERGAGLLELGKHVEGEGIADRLRPR